MKIKDLTGMTFGSLLVVSFDEERYANDVSRKMSGEITRIRRCYICECSLCGRTVSVRGENLTSGNTKGCGCDAAEKTGRTRHSNSLNSYSFDEYKNCWVGISNNTGNKFMFDDADYELVSKFCWYENNDGYMITRVSRDKQLLLHRLIAERHYVVDDKRCVDHINRSRLDCRLSNLRVCTLAENAWNVGVHSNSKSGERGVRWHDKTKKWNAYITLDGRFKSLGYYDNIDDAISARRSAEIMYRGEFAPV